MRGWQVCTEGTERRRRYSYQGKRGKKRGEKSEGGERGRRTAPAGVYKRDGNKKEKAELYWRKMEKYCRK